MIAGPPIIVGVDGSPACFDAVRWAAQDAAVRAVPLTLMAALASTDPSPTDSAHQSGPTMSASRRHLRRAVQAAEDAAHGWGRLALHTEIRSGPAIPALLECSRHAQLVVVGARGFGERSGGPLGSVSDALATRARCPIVIIRGPAGAAPPHGMVVVGVDGSASSAPAIAAAFDEASLRRAPLTAVHAWTDLTLSALFTGDDPDVELSWEAARDTESAVLAESLAGYTAQYPDVVVCQEVVKDRPVRNLLEHAQRAQLLVVGRRGRGGFTSMLLGSTSRALLHSVDRPLMIVRA